MSAPLKALFIGFEETPKAEHGEQIELCKVIKEKKDYDFKGENILPSFLDYHVVFVNLPEIDKSYSYLLKPFCNKNSEIEIFLNGGGIILVICPAKLKYVDNANTYSWCPLYLDIHNDNGETIEPNTQHPLSKIIQKYKTRWQCYFNYPTSEHVIGRNLAKLPVSLSIPYSNGYIILMPLFEEAKYVQVLSDLLDAIKQNYFQKNIPPIITPAPAWLSKYQFDKEMHLTKQFEELKSELQRYKEIRKILYTNGIELTKAVGHLFSELGFKVTEKEHEGLHDLEVEKDNFFSVIEVKGLKGHANVDDLRQLLDHHIEASKQNENAKGIFVLNHHKEDEPPNRKEPFSKDAIRLGTKNEFCMMTTTDLFKIYSDYIEGKIKIQDIIARIKGTSGPLR